jgi:hypothetical protein
MQQMTIFGGPLVPNPFDQLDITAIVTTNYKPDIRNGFFCLDQLTGIHVQQIRPFRVVRQQILKHGFSPLFRAMLKLQQGKLDNNVDLCQT